MIAYLVKWDVPPIELPALLRSSHPRSGLNPRRASRAWVAGLKKADESMKEMLGRSAMRCTSRARERRSAPF